jgi:SAM-dependent methyltransferase
VALGELGRLHTLTPERTRAIRARVLATGFADRAPQPIELAAQTLMPEELRLPLVRRALQREATAAATLTLLFLYAQALPDKVIERALGPQAHGWLVDGGLLVREGDDVRSAFRLQVAENVLIWADEPNAGPDAVMAPGPSTVQLLNTLPATLDGSFLDVGTGPGTFALLAAKRGAGRAVGTDISARAAALARFNASFNDLRIEVREGDLLAPVSGERFDWIVGQPPYVTHPPDEPGVTFMHGGPKGDELALRLLGGVSAHLRPRGVAFVLFDSPIRPTPLHERVRTVVGKAPADVIVFNGPGLTPDRQAMGYAALADPTFGPRYAESALRYRDHIERQRIEEVSHSLVVVRAREKATEEGWTMSLPVAIFPYDWDDLSAYLKGVDLAVAGDDALAASRVRPRDGATVVVARRPGAARDEVHRSIRFDELGLASDRELSEAGALIFDLLATDPSVASAIDRFASAMQQPRADVLPLVVAFVRECLVRALLVPA